MATPSGFALFLDREKPPVIPPVCMMLTRVAHSGIQRRHEEGPQRVGQVPQSKTSPIACGIHHSKLQTQSPESVKVLTKNKTGWFGETAVKDICTVANEATGPDSKLRFEDCFKCDPSHETYGYKSWDGEDFFVHHVISLPLR